MIVINVPLIDFCDVQQCEVSVCIDFVQSHEVFFLLLVLEVMPEFLHQSGKNHPIRRRVDGRDVDRLK